MISEVVIRSAVAEDAEQIMLLRRRIDADRSNRNLPLDPYGGLYPTLEQQQSEIKNYQEDGIFLVAWREKQIVGYAFCFAIYDRAGQYRGNFAVDKDWRRKGIGSALLAQVVDWAKTAPNVQALVCSFHLFHISAARVCKKSGFKVTGRGLAYFIQAYRYLEKEMTLMVR